MRFEIIAMLSTALSLAACSPDPVGPLAGETARVRLASASPDAGTLDLLVNGKTVAQAVARTEVSAPAVLEPGQATGLIRSSGSGTALLTLPLALESGRSYTVMVAGPVGALTAMLSADTGSAGTPPPPPPTPVDSGALPPVLNDLVRFRILHAAPHAPPIDPYLTGATASLDTLPTIQPFAYGSLALTADLIRWPGHWTVEFVQPGSSEVLLTSGDLDAKAGELITVVLGENADHSLRVDVLRE
jgi:hypothetical protein